MSHLPVLLHGFRLFDGIHPRLRDGLAIILHGQEIHAVERIGDVGTLGGYRRIDLGGATLLPGLIDAHCHLTVPFMYDVSLAMLLQARRQIAMNFRTCLMSGVTTVRDLGGFPRHLLAFRARADRHAIPGPRVLTSLSAIAARRNGDLGAPENAPYFAKGLLRWALGGNYAERPTTPAEVRAVCEAMVAMGADWLKTLHQDHSYSTYPRPLPNHSDQSYRALLAVGRAHGIPCALHQTLRSGFVTGVELGFDTLEHIPVDDMLPDDLVDAFVKRGMAIVPTLMALGDVFDEEEVLATVEARGQRHLVSEAARGVAKRIRASLAQKHRRLSPEERHALPFDRRYFEESFPNAVANLRKLHEMGATIGLGTDCGGTYTGLFGRYARELRHYVDAGLSTFETLNIATAGNARILGLSDRIGTIEAGKLADLLAVDGDPLEDIRAIERIRAVFKGGVILPAPRDPVPIMKTELDHTGSGPARIRRPSRSPGPKP